MATWKPENSMLTQKGIEILNKLNAGRGSITNIRVVLGSGRTTESQLINMTKVQGDTKETVISTIETSESGSEISVYINNSDFTESFEVHQIGVYVTHPDYTGEQLYHISQCEVDDFDNIPAFEDNPVTLGYSLFLEHGNSSAIELTVDPQGMITREEYDRGKSEIFTKINSLKPEDVGAVPLGHITQEFKGINPGNLDSTLNTLISEMSSGSVEFISVTFSSSHPILGISNYIFRVDKLNNGNCTIQARSNMSLSTNSGAIEFTRSKTGSTWTQWARTYNEGYKPTYSDVGAAPTGYGLGVVAGVQSVLDDCNNATKNGWYRIKNITANGIGVDAVMRVDSLATTSVTQTAYTNSLESTSAMSIQQRSYFNGAWGPWEWVNPPMNTDVEYRTTERYQGVSVIKKLDAGGNIMWRKENETEWRASTTNYLVEASVE